MIHLLLYFQLSSARCIYFYLLIVFFFSFLFSCLVSCLSAAQPNFTNQTEPGSYMSAHGLVKVINFGEEWPKKWKIHHHGTKNTQNTSGITINQCFLFKCTKKKRFHTASAQTRAKFRKKIKLKKARCRKMSIFLLLFTYFGSAYVNSFMVICYVSMVALYRFMPELFCCVIDI